MKAVVVHRDDRLSDGVQSEYWNAFDELFIKKWDDDGPNWEDLSFKANVLARLIQKDIGFNISSAVKGSVE